MNQNICTKWSFLLFCSELSPVSQYPWVCKHLNSNFLRITSEEPYKKWFTHLFFVNVDLRIQPKHHVDYWMTKSSLFCVFLLDCVLLSLFVEGSTKAWNNCSYPENLAQISLCQISEYNWKFWGCEKTLRSVEGEVAVDTRKSWLPLEKGAWVSWDDTTTVS